jgi:hypothetical protein
MKRKLTSTKILAKPLPSLSNHPLKDFRIKSKTSIPSKLSSLEAIDSVAK